MSTVLITGRTDGKKTKTVTTPVETQPTFQNKQTKNTKQWVLTDVTHIVKFFSSYNHAHLSSKLCNAGSVTYYLALLIYWSKTDKY